MNFNKNQSKSKNEIKKNILKLFKPQYVKFLDSQKIKEIRKMHGESV